MIPPKRGLMITLMASCFTLTVITVGYVMPYQAPVASGDQGSGPSEAGSGGGDGVSVHEALMTYYRPEVLSKRLTVPLRIATETSSQKTVQTGTRVVAGARETFSRRRRSDFGPAGPWQDPGILPVDYATAPPGLVFAPGIQGASPAPQDEEFIGFYYFFGFWPYVPDSDIPGMGGSGGGEGNGSSGGNGFGGGPANPPVPIPGSVWLMGSGLGMLVWCRKRFTRF